MRKALSFLTLFLPLLALGQTPVEFNLLQMTGSSEDRLIWLRAVNNPVTVGSNIYYLPTSGLRFWSSNGTVTTNLVANDYNVQIIGTPEKWTLSVPDSTNTQQAAELSNLTTYTYTNPTPNRVAAGTNIVVVTNGTVYTINSTVSGSTDYITLTTVSNDVGLITNRVVAGIANLSFYNDGQILASMSTNAISFSAVPFLNSLADTNTFSYDVAIGQTLAVVGTVTASNFVGDGSGLTGVSGGSGFPLTSNVSGAGYSLTNLGSLTATGAVTAATFYGSGLGVTNKSGLVDVRAFGAIPDNSTDNATAFANAIAFVTNNNLAGLYFPVDDRYPSGGSTYRTSGKFFLGDAQSTSINPVRFVGDGRSKLLYTGTSGIFIHAYLHMENLHIMGMNWTNGFLNWTNGVGPTYTNYVGYYNEGPYHGLRLDNVQFSGWGIGMVNCYAFAQFINCAFITNGVGLMFGQQPDGGKVDRCYFTDNGVAGIETGGIFPYYPEARYETNTSVQGPEGFGIYNSVFSGNPIDILAGGTSVNAEILQMYTEGATVANVMIGHSNTNYTWETAQYAPHIRITGSHMQVRAPQTNIVINVPTYLEVRDTLWGTNTFIALAKSTADFAPTKIISFNNQLFNDGRNATNFTAQINGSLYLTNKPAFVYQSASGTEPVVSSYDLTTIPLHYPLNIWRYKTASKGPLRYGWASTASAAFDTSWAYESLDYDSGAVQYKHLFDGVSIVQSNNNSVTTFSNRLAPSYVAGELMATTLVGSGSAITSINPTNVIGTPLRMQPDDQFQVLSSAAVGNLPGLMGSGGYQRAVFIPQNSSTSGCWWDLGALDARYISITTHLWTTNTQPVKVRYDVNVTPKISTTNNAVTATAIDNVVSMTANVATNHTGVIDLGAGYSTNTYGIRFISTGTTNTAGPFWIYAIRAVNYN